MRSFFTKQHAFGLPPSSTQEGAKIKFTPITMGQKWLLTSLTLLLFLIGGNSVWAQTGVPCSGTPPVGPITATVSQLSPGDSTTLSVDTTNSPSGLHYQWGKSSTPNGSLTSLSTGITFKTGPLSATTYYKLFAQCGCCGPSTFSAEFEVTVNQPPTLLTAAATVQSGISCNSGTNGVVKVTASGGTAPYTYVWANGATSATNPNRPAGFYNVTVTDASGSTATSAVAINDPTLVSAAATQQTGVSCIGSNGVAKVTASGGTAPYTYFWANGTAVATNSNLSAGTYFVTVTDANGCLATSSAVITNNTLIAAATIQTGLSCNGGSTGVANATASGGTAPYTYEWSIAVGTATISNLSAGDYAVTVTDQNGCTASSGFTMTNNTLTATATVQIGISCNGGTNGVVNVTASGGIAPYTYLWANGVNTATNPNRPAGFYNVTVTDANACTATSAIAINAPTLLTAAATQQTGVLCGVSNGVVKVTASGGTAPYTYLWSQGATTATVSNLSAGTYAVTVTDANGCIATSSVTLNPTSTVVVSVVSQTAVSCFGGNNATATLSAVGGASPYGGLNVTGLSAGIQTLTVTDASFCSATVSVTIAQSTALVATASMSAAVTCNGLSNGSASVMVTGGTPSYTYAWDIGASTSSISGLAASGYVVSVTDANGCYTATYAIVTQPMALTATTVPYAPTCATGAISGINNGSVAVTPAGGSAPYVITQPVSGLTAGAYTFTVTDNQGCTATAAAVVPEGAANTAYFKDADADGFGDPSITTRSCTGVPPASVTNSLDCNDMSSVVFPGAFEVCGSAVDNNCDGNLSTTIVSPTLVNQTVTGSSVNLTWSGSCTFRYRIQVQIVGTSSWKYSYATGAVSSTTITGLASGTYRWAVRAQSGSNLGPITNPMATPNTFTIGTP